MEKFEQVIQDAEKHLEFSERSAKDLNRRIQEISRACSVAERNVEESSAAISASEKNLSILAGQQSDTRKRLSALYRSLIAIPTAPAPNVENEVTHVISTTDSVFLPSQQRERDGAIFRLCFFNALTVTDDLSALVRHAHFFHSGLRKSLNGDVTNTQSSQLSVEAIEDENPGNQVVDAMTPLCIYALTGKCTDKVPH
jgi:hypothetical protein